MAESEITSTGARLSKAVRGAPRVPVTITVCWILVSSWSAEVWAYAAWPRHRAAPDAVRTSALRRLMEEVMMFPS